MSPQGLPDLTPPRPIRPSGNPIWDEIQKAHSTLSPSAQRAVALSGVPQTALANEQPAPAQPDRLGMPSAISAKPLPDMDAVGAPPELPKPEDMSLPAAGSMASSGISATPAPQLGERPAPSPMEAHQSELARLTKPPLQGPEAHTKTDTGLSGIGQIHNPWARHGLEALEGIGSMVVPQVLSALPGTQLHHNELVNQQEGYVNQGEAQATGEANRTHLGAEAGELTARAANEQSEADQRGKPLPKTGDPTKTIETEDGIMQFNPDTGKYDIPVGEAPGKNSTTHVVTPDGSVIAIKTNAKTGEVTHEVVYHGDPKVESDLTELQINGKPHKVIVNKRDGSVIKDLGEAGKTPVAGAEDRRTDTSYQFNIGELNKLGKPIEDLGLRLGRLNDTIAQNSPQADALVAPELLTVMAGGMGSGLRMNEAEIARIVGGRSKWETLKASINKWQLDPKLANSITPEQRQEIRVLVKTVGDKLGAKQAILDDARSQLLGAQSPEDHRRIVSEAHRKVTAVDQGPQASGQTVGYSDGGKSYNIPSEQEAEFLNDHPNARKR